MNAEACVQQPIAQIVLCTVIVTALLTFFFLSVHFRLERVPTKLEKVKMDYDKKIDARIAELIGVGLTPTDAKTLTMEEIHKESSELIKQLRQS